MNSAMKKKQENDFILSFIDSPCPNVDMGIDSYDEALSDCHAMLQYSIDMDDKGEIHFWRGQITKTQMEKKAYLEEMKNKNEKGLLTI